MRKRDKKKEKARLEAREQKKREVYVDVNVTGAKRGKGHRQRVSLAPERLEARETAAKERR